MSTRARIAEVASAAFVRDGLLRARLEDIRREAGVSVGALYHHFPDKEMLHAEVWLAALGAYQEGFLDVIAGNSDAENGVKDAVRYHLRWTTSNREAASLLYGARPTGAQAVERTRGRNREFFATVQAWWDIHARYGALRAVAPELIHALWLGPADSYCRLWVQGQQQDDAASVAEELAAAAWAALQGPNPDTERKGDDRR